jgi:iron-sulfur cluster assembly accessory protein
MSSPVSDGVNAAAVVAVPTTDDFVLAVTDAAVGKVKDFAARMPEAAGKPLRVFIQGGGCSGFQYGFTFDDKKPTDYVLAVKGIEVVVDKTSSLKLHGATVDWIEDFRGAGFSVENPNATSGCGCGKSFS